MIWNSFSFSDFLLILFFSAVLNACFFPEARKGNTSVGWEFEDLLSSLHLKQQANF